MKFLDRLRNYDVDNVSDKIIKKVKPIIEQDAFDPEEIGKKVAPCRSLAKWCTAVVDYTEVAKKVEPKKKKLAEMNE